MKKIALFNFFMLMSGLIAYAAGPDPLELPVGYMAPHLEEILRNPSLQTTRHMQRISRSEDHLADTYKAQRMLGNARLQKQEEKREALKSAIERTPPILRKNARYRSN